VSLARDDHRQAIFEVDARLLRPSSVAGWIPKCSAAQVLVRFACDGTNVTDRVIDKVQREGTCWMSGTEWEGEPAMRISVCNWRTTEDDIRRSARAILAQVSVAERAST
jgi:hypothetical protein